MLFVFIFVCGVYTLNMGVAKAQVSTIVRTPFSGQIAQVEICCNGIKFSLTPQYQTVARGTFIMNWTSMTPVPSLGLGLYSWWSLIPGEKVLGDARAGGVCLTVASECYTSEPVTFDVYQVGTTLL